MAKEKTTGKAENDLVGQVLKDISDQVKHLIEILERMEKRLNGGF